MNVTLHDLTFAAPSGKVILNNINAIFPSGRISVISGSNGSGKSTLLHAIAGLLPLSPAQVKYDDADIAEKSVAELARIRAIVRQEPRLPEDITVRQLLQLARYAFGGNREKDASILKKALCDLDCTALEQRKLNTLSGGERRRVCFALALAQTPGLLLLDEVDANLDAGFRKSLPQLLKRLRSERGLTVIMVMHDLDLALHCADMFYGMEAGKITFCGDRTAPDFEKTVAGFAGSNYRIFTDEAGTLRALPRFEF